MEVLTSVQDVEGLTSHMMEEKPRQSLLFSLFGGENSCLTHLAQTLRDDMWGLNLEGITMTSQQEQTGLYKWNDVLLNWASRAS